MAQVDGSVLADYRSYMRRKGYAMTTVRHRLRIAQEWTGEHEWTSGVTFRDVERWLAARPVGRPTQRTHLVALRAWYWWALREGLCEHDPTALVDGPRLDRRLPRPAREDDIAATAARVNPQMLAMIAVMSCGGLRCCEVARLRWEDVNLEDGSIYVFGKGSKERRVWVDDSTRALLAALPRTPGPVFPGRFGNARAPEQVSRLVSRAFRRHGSTTTAHQLRHRCATVALVESDGDLLAVRDMLGHASVATTQQYTALTPGRVEAIGKRIGMPPAPAD